MQKRNKEVLELIKGLSLNESKIVLLFDGEGWTSKTFAEMTRRTDVANPYLTVKSLVHRGKLRRRETNGVIEYKLVK